MNPHMYLVKAILATEDAARKLESLIEAYEDVSLDRDLNDRVHNEHNKLVGLSKDLTGRLLKQLSEEAAIQEWATV